MTNMTSLFSRLVLALTLATGAGAAIAVPARYHVDVDTRTLSGDGYLNLTLASFSAATALTSNFTGNASGASILTGAVSGDLSTSAAFDTSDLNYLDQLVHFGGKFGFDVLLDFDSIGAGMGTESADFLVSLTNTDFSAYIGVDGPLATITFTPGVGSSFVTGNPFATVTAIDPAAVPEPGQWLLMATGLLLLGAMVRRRSL